MITILGRAVRILVRIGHYCQNSKTCRYVIEMILLIKRGIQIAILAKKIVSPLAMLDQNP